ncbi:MAG TPA: 23S rRNA (adenine(2503)-C(2))-methyltransferase RlmN [Gemmatimonadaceae bacterium]|nr:23S rRNA (adenine(2503)-C(2))-methyltransferase RlmN [Gemmatimonadaceae bacterium]
MSDQAKRTNSERQRSEGAGRTEGPARTNLLDLAPAQADQVLRAWMDEIGAPSYRAAQVLRRLWVNPAKTFEDMKELPAALRESLAQRFELPRLAVAAEQASTDGTRKFLFRLHDNEAIETVAIPEGDRVTICVSSQAGCALQCAFCATGAMGFTRNLAVHEIACQVRELKLLDEPIRVTNIVFMGMGEPLMNWKAVDPVLTILNDENGLGIGARHITVSTVGVLPGIVALGERPEQFRLAISIHAPTDALRRELMPINVKYPLADVIAAAKVFDRRVTFEYVMLGGVNDAVEHALELGRLARECKAFVNLIPLHPGGTRGFTPSTPERMRAFVRELKKQSVEVAVRKSRGMDIAAACGQLRVERLGRRAPGRPDKHGDIQVA